MPSREEYLELRADMRARGRVYHDVIKRKDGTKRRYLKAKNMLPLDAQVIYIRACILFGEANVKIYKAKVPYWARHKKQEEPDAVSIVLTPFWDQIKEK